MAFWNRPMTADPQPGVLRALCSWDGFRSLIRTCIEQGAHVELLKLVPGVGKVNEGILLIHKVAIAFHAKLRDDADRAAFANDLQAALSQPQFQQEIRHIVAQELPDGSERQQALLTDMISQIPQRARTAFSRPEDRSGRTVPDTWRCQSVDHLREILPVRLPSLTTGDEVPGRREWRLQERLGVGGFGEVWLVKHADLGTWRACKFCLDVELRARLLTHESRINSLMRNQGCVPGVVPLVDASLQGEIPWLMFEYISGGTLADWVATWPQDQTARTRLALESLHKLAVCTGKFHAFTPPVVHRDLKPANILRDGDQLWIIDFGISDLFAETRVESARPTANDASLPTPTIVRASYTPGYASPQQRQRAPSDPRDDIHALGVLLYQMLVGDMHLPMGRDYREDLAELHIPSHIVDLVARCAKEKQELRPAHGTALAAEVVQLLSLAASAPGDSRLSLRERASSQERDFSVKDTSLEPERPFAERMATVATPGPLQELVAQLTGATSSASQLHDQARAALSKCDFAAAAQLLSRIPEKLRIQSLWYEATTKRDRLRDLEATIAKLIKEHDLRQLSGPVYEALQLFPGRSDLLAIQSNLPDIRIREPEASAPGGQRTVIDLHDIEIPFRWCPPGKFKMGSPTSEAGREDRENQVNVELTHGFWLGEVVVTQELFRAVLNPDPSHFKGPQRPVEQVSWEEAQAFCQKLTQQLRDEGILAPDWRVCLPTEARWEYACRAGTTTAYFFGNDAARLGQFAWFDGNSGKETHPVGTREANPWGLRDMHGNVWEWCADWYGDKLTGGTNPAGASSGSGRVDRGGCWFISAGFCRSANRSRNDPSNRFNDLGFRLCLSSD